ncbi:unnamed protein product [Ceutorhynchus assimilis]|uniref:Non-structural maintenance of chromosomes element 4 n=1 Tax=Ceutorhynchus assimilis TaxID=467358 RepID=A0A9N9MIR6_9CUCU|nr:unnamed protein product [Ceutorhynchus assimilis]
MMEMEVEDNRENHRARSTRALNGTAIRSTQERKSFYRELLSKAEAIGESNNIGLQTVNEIHEILLEANELNGEVSIEKKVENADETLLDSMVISSSSDLLKKCIEAVDVFTVTYDANEFADKINSFMATNNEDEEEITVDHTKLLDHARALIPKVPDYNNVYGSYDLNALPVPKQKKERVKAVKEQIQKKEPEKVVNLEKEEEGIELVVKQLSNVLEEAYQQNGEEPVNYYSYIIDTDSYVTTIENMFYFAFLVRDGKASIDLDKNNVPVIRPIHKRELKNFRDKNGINAQIVSNISMGTWEKYKKTGLLQRKKQSMSQR